MGAERKSSGDAEHRWGSVQPFSSNVLSQAAGIFDEPFARPALMGEKPRAARVCSRVDHSSPYHGHQIDRFQTTGQASDVLW